MKPVCLGWILPLMTNVTNQLLIKEPIILMQLTATSQNNVCSGGADFAVNTKHLMKSLQTKKEAHDFLLYSFITLNVSHRISQRAGLYIKIFLMSSLITCNLLEKKIGYITQHWKPIRLRGTRGNSVAADLWLGPTIIHDKIKFIQVFFKWKWHVEFPPYA